MAIDPDRFSPLLPSARAELARQITFNEPSATKLVENGHFGWSLAFTIARELASEDGPSVQMLRRAGLSAGVAAAIAAAVYEVRWADFERAEWRKEHAARRGLR